LPNNDLQKFAVVYGVSKIEDRFATAGCGKDSARRVLALYFAKSSQKLEPFGEDAEPTHVRNLR
jgi:hypothetical protein